MLCSPGGSAVVVTSPYEFDRVTGHGRRHTLERSSVGGRAGDLRQVAQKVRDGRRVGEGVDDSIRCCLVTVREQRGVES